MIEEAGVPTQADEPRSAEPLLYVDDTSFDRLRRRPRQSTDADAREDEAAPARVGARGEELKRQVLAECSGRYGQGSERADRPVLFNCVAGNTVPNELLLNETLAPVDKVLWILLLRHARRHGVVSFLPTYPELARQGNVTTPRTVAASLAVLRATRWVPVLDWQSDRPGVTSRRK